MRGLGGKPAGYCCWRCGRIYFPRGDRDLCPRCLTAVETLTGQIEERRIYRERLRAIRRRKREELRTRFQVNWDVHSVASTG